MNARLVAATLATSAVLSLAASPALADRAGDGSKRFVSRFPTVEQTDKRVARAEGTDSTVAVDARNADAGARAGAIAGTTAPEKPTRPQGR